MGQHSPSVGGPWASSVLEEERKEGEMKERARYSVQMVQNGHGLRQVLKLGWGWKSPEI